MVEASTIWDLVERRAAITPDAVMIVDERRRQLTFQGFKAACEHTAAGLARRGVGVGAVVSRQLPNGIEAAVLAAALARLGAVQNPLVPMLREREVSFICRQAHSALLIVPSVFRSFDHAAMAQAVAADHPLDVLVVDDDLPNGPPDALPEHAASAGAIRWYFYTSGTTAEPKGAKHCDQGLQAASKSVTTALRVTGEDRLTLLAPVAHVGGTATW